MACTMVTMELKASGMAATAKATANINAFSTGILLYRLKTNTTALIIIITIASWLPNLSRLTCSGVLFSLVAFISAAILPISVSIPVAVTSATARPPVTRLPE